MQEKRITSDILRRKALEALVRSAVAVDQDGTVLDLQLDGPDSQPEETNAEVSEEASESQTDNSEDLDQTTEDQNLEEKSE